MSSQTPDAPRAIVDDAAVEQRRARERYTLRFAGVLVAGVFIYHFRFGLSWSATGVMLIIVAAGSLLLHQYSRRRNRARLLQAMNKSTAQALCSGCGWRGELSALRQEDDHGGIAFLCPVCGHQAGHTHQAHV
jgi:hypothetical protein